MPYKGNNYRDKHSIGYKRPPSGSVVLIHYFLFVVNQRFHGSCLPANSTMAETNCRQQSGAIFTLDDLKMSYGLVVLESAILDVGAVWIDNTGSNSFMILLSHICVWKTMYSFIQSVYRLHIPCYKRYVV